MKTAYVFTAAQTKHLNTGEFAHYLELGLVEIDAPQAQHKIRALEEELEAACEENKELSGELQSLRGLWQRCAPALREFAQELMGNDTAFKLALEEEPPHVRR